MGDGFFHHGLAFLGRKGCVGLLGIHHGAHDYPAKQGMSLLDHIEMSIVKGVETPGE